VPSVVKINVLTVPAEQREVLEQRFASRKGLVENSDGFEWFELLRPVGDTPDEYLVYTRWRSEEDFEKWMAGSMRGAHAPSGGAGGGDAPSGPGGAPGGSAPGGERPAATGATLWSFEVVQSAGPAPQD
jgi:heme oxygenase (mycobilin-producing)